LDLSETSREYVSSPYAERAAPASPRKLTYALPVEASDAALITARDHAMCAADASGSRHAAAALST
jgi:hypothetical protein